MPDFFLFPYSAYVGATLRYRLFVLHIIDLFSLWEREECIMFFFIKKSIAQHMIV